MIRPSAGVQIGMVHRAPALTPWAIVYKLALRSFVRCQGILSASLCFNVRGEATRRLNCQDETGRRACSAQLFCCAAFQSLIKRQCYLATPIFCHPVKGKINAKMPSVERLLYDLSHLFDYQVVKVLKDGRRQGLNSVLLIEVRMRPAPRNRRTAQCVLKVVRVSRAPPSA